MNQEGGKAEDQAKAATTEAMQHKHQAQEQARSIRDQVREKIKAHYEGTT
jgi:hypothetical protein